MQTLLPKFVQLGTTLGIAEEVLVRAETGIYLVELLARGTTARHKQCWRWNHHLRAFWTFTWASYGDIIPA